MQRVYFAARYDKGTADYINCPMTKEEYDRFLDALTTAERPCKIWELFLSHVFLLHLTLTTSGEKREGMGDLTTLRAACPSRSWLGGAATRFASAP